MNLSEKKKLVPRGKRLNPTSAKHRAEKFFGKDFRKTLREKLAERGIDCSATRLTQAFGGEAPFVLFNINQIIKEAENN